MQKAKEAHPECFNQRINRYGTRFLLIGCYLVIDKKIHLTTSKAKNRIITVG